jgi:oligoendopeptidase F
MYDTDPYVFTNYQDDLKSAFVLAHELGHAMHLLYASDEQPRIYGRPQLAIAELPSNLHEALLARHLLDVADDPAFRAHVLDVTLRRTEDNLYAHAMRGAFTHCAVERHQEGEQLTATRLTDVYEDLLAEFRAPVVRDDRASEMWLGDNHIRKPYGSYPYVLGNAGALSVVQRLSTGELQPERYRRFLRAGSSAYPLDLLDDLGLDFRSPTPTEEATTVYAGYLDDLETVIEESSL